MTICTSTTSPADPSANPKQVEARAGIAVDTWRNARLVLVLLAFLLSPAAGGFANGNRSAVTGEMAAPPPFRLTVSVDDDPALGPANAPVTIVEFGDFLCPYCAQFHQQTLPALLASYPDQIRYVYRDFPILGGASVRAAQAAACAGEQGKYWEYHEALFSGATSFDFESLVQLSRGLGLAPGLFDACLASGRYAGEVHTDLAAGLALRINGTPTFFINGRPLAGAQSLDAIRQIIDDELAGK